jgi:hypothetical protein
MFSNAPDHDAFSAVQAEAMEALKTRQFVRFPLPVGAMLGGFCHLGGGEFLGQVPESYLPVELREARNLRCPPSRLEYPHMYWDCKVIKGVASSPDAPALLCENLFVEPGIRHLSAVRLAVDAIEAGERVLRSVDTGAVLKTEPLPAMPPLDGPAELPTKVTREALVGRIAKVTYEIRPDGRTTVCELTMVNGFSVRGESSAACESEFVRTLGEKAAYAKALDQAWAFEGYLLRERRHQAGLV